MDQSIRLTDAPRALKALGVSLSYLKIWRRVVAGDIPAHRDKSNKSHWRILAADLPAIAAALSASLSK